MKNDMHPDIKPGQEKTQRVRLGLNPCGLVQGGNMGGHLRVLQNFYFRKISSVRRVALQPGQTQLQARADRTSLMCTATLA